MITLFRRIRERLIASGSITKYLLYAIGEILLVVIGILIALQVNNWNEARKTENLISENLYNVKQNLLADTTRINEVYQDLYIKDLNAQYLSDFLYERESVYDTLRLKKAFFESSTTTEFTPIRLSYNTMVNTGIINTIESDELQQALYEYYEVDDYSRQIQEQEERYSIELSEARFPYLSQHDFREKVKTALQWGDWEETPEADTVIHWEKVRSDGFYVVALDKVLGLNVADFDKLERLKNQQKKLLTLLEKELK